MESKFVNVAIKAIRQWKTDTAVDGYTEVFDLDNQQLMLVDNGWHQAKRIYNVVIHISVQDNKFWIEHDSTQEGIANYLERLGIPKKQIVLGFYPLHHRKHTEYAAN